MRIKTPIMPISQFMYNCKTMQMVTEDYDLNNEPIDYKNVAFFAATGFFFDDNTFYKNIRTLPNASYIEIDNQNYINSIRQYWDWFYKPEVNDLNTATALFGEAFESVIFKHMANKKAMLPLSGGIDSRTIAAAIPKGHQDLISYSYNFENGGDEVKFAKNIADVKGLPFQEFEIPRGYLWKKFEELVETTGCYNEVTHSRQMAVIDDIEKLGELFLLGHGGEIFRLHKVDASLDDAALLDHTIDEIVKKEGFKLAGKLWEHWELEGSLIEFIRNTIKDGFDQIQVEDNTMKLTILDFKYYAVKRSHVNLKIFNKSREVLLPFLQQQVLDMVCRTNVNLLTERKIQIAYIKNKSPELARIPWQNYYPLNLYNFKDFKKPRNIPVRLVNFLNRKLKEDVLGNKLITRNWENQLLGEHNDSKLRQYLLENPENDLDIPQSILNECYIKFKEDHSKHVFPISILLAMKHFKKGKYKDRYQSALKMTKAD